jgi:hypothetical protein
VAAYEQVSIHPPIHFIFHLGYRQWDTESNAQHGVPEGAAEEKKPFDQHSQSAVAMVPSFS